MPVSSFPLLGPPLPVVVIVAAVVSIPAPLSPFAVTSAVPAPIVCPVVSVLALSPPQPLRLDRFLRPGSTFLSLLLLPLHTSLLSGKRLCA